MKELILKNLSIGYANKPIVEGINQTVDRPKFITILGANGTGKSTLLKTILGIEKPLKGNLYMGNESLSDAKSATHAEYFATVFSKLPIVPEILVSELIQINGKNAIENKPSTLEEIQKIAHKIGIHPLLDRYANTLSDGQLQLVMMARALQQKTAYIIMDEPTAHLDLGNQYKIFGLCANLVENERKTIIMVTHEVDLALQFANEIWWIENHRLYAGIPEEIAFEHRILSKLSNEILAYNSVQQTFTVATAHKKTIGVVGDDEMAFWLRKALTRDGYKIVNNGNEIIRVDQNIMTYKEQTFSSIQSILEHLKYHE